MNNLVMGLTLSVLSIAAYTDVRHRRISNLLTYVGIAIAICAAVVFNWNGITEPCPFRSTPTVMTFLPEMEPIQTTHEKAVFQLGIVESHQAISGAIGCFAILLLMYACGGIGGGDVKLGAFVGAATGLETGALVLCISHLLAGVFVTLCLIWRAAGATSRPMNVAETEGSQRKTKFSGVMARGIPMAVFYLLGTLLVTWIA